jgi:hypothetical protein
MTALRACRRDLDPVQTILPELKINVAVLKQQITDKKKR